MCIKGFVGKEKFSMTRLNIFTLILQSNQSVQLKNKEEQQGKLFLLHQLNYNKQVKRVKWVRPIEKRRHSPGSVHSEASSHLELCVNKKVTGVKPEVVVRVVLCTKRLQLMNESVLQTRRRFIVFKLLLPVKPTHSVSLCLFIYPLSCFFFDLL